MNVYFQLIACLLLLQGASGIKARGFHWGWKESQNLFSAHSLRNSKMSKPEKAALAKAIEAQIRPGMWALGIKSENQLVQAALNASVEMINLNQGGAPEVVAQVQGFCSVDGNCDLWFFQRTPRGYKLLIDAIGQSFTVQKTSTNGFWDIVVAMHGSATDQWLKVYRYARGRYWRSACYDADWAPLENGIVHQLKEPRITPSSCGK